MKFLILLLSVALLAGCAVSPQQVLISPSSSQEMPAATPGRDVIDLTVLDTRATQTLGTLGGTYDETATLSASNDVRADLERLLRARLAAAGYLLESGSDALVMTVSLSQLEYERVSATVGSEVQVRAVLTLSVDDGRRFIERVYRSSNIQTRITRPTADDNRVFLEEALNNSLDRMLQDASLHDFLAQP